MRTTIATLLSLSLLIPVAACNRQKAPLTPTPPPWLEEAVAQQVAQAAPEAQPVGDQIYTGTAYREGDKMQWQITLDPGHCYYFSGAGDQSVEELYINVWDPSGDRVAKEKSGPRLILEHCATVPGLYKFEMKVDEGHGHFAVGVFSKTAPPPPPAPVEPPPPAGPNLGKIVDDMAKASAPDSERVGDHFAGHADHTDWYVALETGKCYWFIGAGDDDVKELYLYLWDPADKRITANKSENNRVNVGHCPTSSGMYHFQAKVNSGSGKYKVGVFAKKK